VTPFGLGPHGKQKQFGVRKLQIVGTRMLRRKYVLVEDLAKSLQGNAQCVRGFELAVVLLDRLFQTQHIR
jgi:hypothetical protein